MSRATIILDRDFTIGEVPRRLFGSFVEHMGRCVYTGIYEPGHPEADERGFRQDVLKLVKELGATVVRYPGGNFVSGYNWEDGVGPVEDRPRRLDGAWHTVETNAFGLHEFMDWSKEAGVEIMEASTSAPAASTRPASSSSTRTTPAAPRSPTGASRTARRSRSTSSSGASATSSTAPGRSATRPPTSTAGSRRRPARPCASSTRPSSSSPSARRTPACRRSARGSTRCSRTRTTRSTTSRCTPTTRSTTATPPSFLASAVDMDYFIESVVATCDAVRAKRKAQEAHQPLVRRVERLVPARTRHRRPAAQGRRQGWREHPRLIEDAYNVTDAVVVGTLLNSLLRHGDRVSIANQAQLVNVIAPIRSEENGPAWRQTIFWPFARMAALAPGRSCAPPSPPTGSRRRSSAMPTSSTSRRPTTRRPAASPCSSPTAGSRRRPTSTVDAARARGCAGSSAPSCSRCPRAGPPHREHARGAGCGRPRAARGRHGRRRLVGDAHACRRCRGRSSSSR